jgi:hypothetical protein
MGAGYVAGVDEDEDKAEYDPGGHSEDDDGRDADYEPPKAVDKRKKSRK